MDPFTSSPLRDWRLETRYDANGHRHHQRLSGSDCWRSMRHLGKGGYGDVWQEQCLSGPSKNAVRAVKRLSKRESRFTEISRRELNALVAFSNSQIPQYRNYFVQFLGWFDEKEYFYIAMEFLEHGDLQKYITKPFPESEAASITAQVAQALQYMHQQNFVHRDIKPMNILVSCLGPHWHVKVADFGIAKNIDGTTHGTIQGTWAYMAPELWDNSPSPYTAAVDIWALGAVAFCLRTGFPPFRSVKHLNDYASDHKTHFPVRPLGTSSGFCMNFVLSTMAESPERRLNIDQVLTHDWLISSWVSPSANPPLGIDAKDSQKTLDASPSNAWSHTYSSPSIQQSRSTSAKDSQKTLETTPSNAWSHTYSSAGIQQTQPHPSSTPIIDPEPLPLPLPSRTSPLRSAARALGESLGKGIEKLAAMTTYREQWPQDGAERIETPVANQQRGESSKRHSEKIEETKPNPTAIYDMQKRPSRTKNMKEGGVNLGQEVTGYEAGCKLASGSSDGTIKIWDLAKGQCILTLRGHLEAVRSVAWTQDDSRLASASYDKTVKIWNAATGQCLLTLKGHIYWVQSVAWAHDSGQLASGGDDNTVKIWDPTTDKCISTLEGHGDRVTSVAWSHSSSLLASGSTDETIKIWDPATGQCILTLEGHDHWVQSLAWTKDDSRLVSGSVSATVKIWNTVTGQCISTLEGHSHHVQSVAWAHDDSQLASGSADETIKIWDPATGRCLSTLKGHDHWVQSVAWAHDKSRLASGSYDKTVKIWDPETGQCQLTLEGHSHGVTSVAWSHDGSRLV